MCKYTDYMIFCLYAYMYIRLFSQVVLQLNDSSDFKNINELTREPCIS